jgi:hypothetical protein
MPTIFLDKPQKRKEPSRITKMNERPIPIPPTSGISFEISILYFKENFLNIDMKDTPKRNPHKIIIR